MKLIFSDDCVTARLSGRMNPDLVGELDAKLAPYEPGYFFNPAFKRHVWDGKHHFLNPETMAFPAGLAHHVVDFLRASGTEPEIVDERPPATFPVTDTTVHGVTLEADQLEAVRQAAQVGRGTLCLPTGFGKTEVAAVLARAVAPKRVLFLVDKKGLLTQTAKRFEERLGMSVGRLGGGYRETDQVITIATVQTCWARRKTLRHFFDSIHMVIFDECHRIAKTALKLLYLIHAPVRLGLSATIKEAPRKMYVEAFLGPIVHETTFEELVESGRAAVPQITMYRVGGVVRGDDFNQVYWNGIVTNTLRNRIVLATALKHVDDGDQVMVMIYRIEHGERLRAELAAALNRRIPFLHGETPLNVIDETKEKFQARRLPIMVVSTIFDFGQDVPAVDAMIMAAAGKAPLRTIQRMGRATRRKAGDNTVEIYDFFDTMHPWLRDHAVLRQRTYKRKGFPATVLAMPQYAA